MYIIFEPIYSFSFPLWLLFPIIDMKFPSVPQRMTLELVSLPQSNLNIIKRIFLFHDFQFLFLFSWCVPFQVKRPLQNAVSGLQVNLHSTFGFAFIFLVHPLSWMFLLCFQDISGISEVVEASRNHEVSNGNQALEDTNGGASSYGRFGLRFPSISTSFLSRTRSATNAVLQQTRSSSQQ